MERWRIGTKRIEKKSIKKKKREKDEWKKFIKTMQRGTGETAQWLKTGCSSSLVQFPALT